MTNETDTGGFEPWMDDELNPGEVEFWEPSGERFGNGVEESPEVVRPVFDLEERTACFGEQIVLFAKRIPRNPVNDRLIDQIVGAGTSVAANYCEADEGVSKKDFTYRIGICKKEAKETRLFLRMIATAEPYLKPSARVLWREATELIRIFATIIRKCQPLVIASFVIGHF